MEKDSGPKVMFLSRTGYETYKKDNPLPTKAEEGEEKEGEAYKAPNPFIISLLLLAAILPGLFLALERM